MTLSVEEQIAALAARYSERAEAYDRLWSPAIQPVAGRLLDHLPLAGAARVIDVGTGAGAMLSAIRRAAPHAAILGIDNAEGMLRLARQRHAGPLVLMNAEKLDLPDDQFNVAVIAFVLFHLPHPERCLAEVCRVLRPGGSVGTATWGAQTWPAVNETWDEQLTQAGAKSLALPATDSLTCCDTETKMADLLGTAGFTSIRTWTEQLVHRWTPADHFEHQSLVTSRSRLESIDAVTRESCLRHIHEQLASASEVDYTYRGDVVLATAAKPERRALERIERPATV